MTNTVAGIGVQLEPWIEEAKIGIGGLRQMSHEDLRQVIATRVAQIEGVSCRRE